MKQRLKPAVTISADAPTEGLYASHPYNNKGVIGTSALRKKEIGIEDLIAWAYADQMVHVAQPEAAMMIGAARAPSGYRHAPLDAVDASGGGGWFTAAPDAFVVHEIVSTLPTLRAQLPDDCIGRAGPGVSAGTLPRVDMVFNVRRAQLVMTHGIDRTRPDWIADPVLIVERGEIIYAKSKNGTVKRDRKTGRQIIAEQMVRFRGDKPWDVARARVIYSHWLSALLEVKDRLRGRALASHVVTGELPPARPWA